MTAEISQRLEADLKEAMKSGNAERRSAIRLLRSAFKYREIELGHPLSDDEAVDVIQDEIKQRRDSIDAYSKAGRTDLSFKEQVELDILLDYLPEDQKPLDEELLKQIVEQKAEELDLNQPGDMRVFMPALIEATGGRADNRLLSTLASAELRRRAEEKSG
ncbi:MAG: GatB/YqeY domain-containing protein [Thermomicrobiales bacterium]